MKNDNIEHLAPAEVIKDLQKEYFFTDSETKQLAISLLSIKKFEEFFLILSTKYNISLEDIVSTSLALGSCVQQQSEVHPSDTVNSSNETADVNISSKDSQPTSKLSEDSYKLSNDDVVFYQPKKTNQLLNSKQRELEKKTIKKEERELQIAARNLKIADICKCDEERDFRTALLEFSGFSRWLVSQYDFEGPITAEHFLHFNDYLYDVHPYSPFKEASESLQQQYHDVKSRFKHTFIEFLRESKLNELSMKTISMHDYLNEWLHTEFKTELAPFRITINDEYEWGLVKKECDQLHDNVLIVCKEFHKFRDKCLNKIYNNRELARSAVTHPTALAYRKPHFHFGDQPEGRRLVEFRGKFSNEIRSAVNLQDYYLISVYGLNEALKKDEMRSSCRTDYKTVYQCIKKSFESDAVDWQHISKLSGYPADWPEPENHVEFVKSIGYKIRTCLRFFVQAGVLRNEGRDYLYMYPQLDPTFIDIAKQYENYYRKPDFVEDLKGSKEGKIVDMPF